MSSDTLVPARRPLILTPRWLIGPGVDLGLLLGSVLVSFGLFAAWRLGHLPTATLVLLWVFVFHGPHFWGTLSRTVMDRSEWPERRRLFAGSLLWFLVGPAFVGLSRVFTGEWAGANFVSLFFFLAALWAYHHVVKQHFGFLALYRAKHGDFDRGELLWQKWYLIASLWIPAVMVLTSQPAWLLELPWLKTWAASDPQTATRVVLDAGKAVLDGGPVVFWALQALFALSLVRRVAQGRGINLPVVLVVLTSVGLHWVVVRSVLFLPPEFVAADAVGGKQIAHYAFVPLVTIFHNIQYHALIWSYNRTKYHGPDAEERYGPAAAVNRNLAVYFACGLLFTVFSIGVQLIGGELDWKVFTDPQNPAWVWIATGIWGWSFMHYYLDSRIWRVRSDEKLRAVLGI
ncbi:MAG: hypothetical protein R3F30_16060 [Planctomycetota bacterium]